MMKLQTVLLLLVPIAPITGFRKLNPPVQATVEAPIPLLFSHPLGDSIASSQQKPWPAPAQVIDRDAPYIPTSEPIVLEMLQFANVDETDVVYDLGSGDGRIVIAAAQQYGARGVGIEIDPALVEEATENAQQAGVSDRVQFIQQDLFDADLRDATVVTLYLLQAVNLQLRPKLLTELRPGTRIVSQSFDLGDWEPDRVTRVNGRTLYYWVVPEEVPAHLLSEPSVIPESSVTPELSIAPEPSIAPESSITE